MEHERLILHIIHYLEKGGCQCTGADTALQQVSVDGLSWPGASAAGTGGRALLLVVVLTPTRLSPLNQRRTPPGHGDQGRQDPYLIGEGWCSGRRRPPRTAGWRDLQRRGRGLVADLEEGRARRRSGRAGCVCERSDERRGVEHQHPESARQQERAGGPLLLLRPPALARRYWRARTWSSRGCRRGTRRWQEDHRDGGRSRRPRHEPRRKEREKCLATMWKEAREPVVRVAREN